MSEQAQAFDEIARFRQPFLLGLARERLDAQRALAGLVGAHTPRNDVLALLALMAQRQRFSRRSAVKPQPTPEVARMLHDDPRPMVSGPARRAVIRLRSSVEKSLAAFAIAAVTRRISTAGRRLHPFDLPDLAGYIKSEEDCLGPAERAFLALSRPDDEEATLRTTFDTITRETWTSFPGPERRAFLARERAKDPDGARALLESCFASEPAAVRAMLLEALNTRLGQPDLAFLQGLATNRSQAVRAAAGQLIARVPGTGDYEARIAEAAACFSRTETGTLSKLLAKAGIAGADQPLVFSLISRNPADAHADRRRIFTGIPLCAIASRVGVGETEILDALPKQEWPVVSLLLETALTEGDRHGVQRIVTHRLTAAGAAAQAPIVIDLAQRTRVVLDPSSAKALLASPAWQAIEGPYQASPAHPAPRDDGLLISVAVMMPRESMPAFLESIASIPLSAARGARDFADLVLALPDPHPTDAQA